MPDPKGGARSRMRRHRADRVLTMRTRAGGTFDIQMTPGPPELDGQVSRFNFRKTFHGDLQATGEGVMMSCGDPQTGSAGYVGIETIQGQLGDRHGRFALQQLGMMQSGTPTLHYEVVPGSGDGELEGITGTFNLTVEDDGTHRYELEYEL